MFDAFHTRRYNQPGNGGHGVPTLPIVHFASISGVAYGAAQTNDRKEEADWSGIVAA
jgi:hypothetical protein